MSLTLESISPVPIADSNLPIALRPAADFPPLRVSVFDDPGDEKSWRISQRAENLSEYYADREPSWYASAVAPLQGADRVLDLGCGPGLALRALRDQGSSTVLGVDRWPAFVASADPDTPIVAHDLSLPMPFLESASYDGVLSHYALDYVSPICVRQVLREAYRVLRPGGRLVVYLAAIGLAGGDESRTVAYSPRAVRTLLEEAGFAEAEVEASSNGRNTAVRAWRSIDDVDSEALAAAEPRTKISGDTQLLASFANVGGRLSFELSGHTRDAAISVELPPTVPDDDQRVSVCARASVSPKGGTELQLWTWRGLSPVAVERVSVEFEATEMRIADGGRVLHASSWSPDWLSLELPADAHTRIGDLPAGTEMDDAERGAEGRRIVVESVTEDGGEDAWRRLGPGRHRFLIRQASRINLATLDREWLDGSAHGVALDASQLVEDEQRELLLWAGWRQALLYLGGTDWWSIHDAVERRRTELCAPVALVDPALARGKAGQPLPAEVASLASRSDSLFVLLGSDSLDLSNEDDLVSLADHLLLADPDAKHPLERDATENLRHLTERLQLTRLRQASGLSWSEVGRRAPLR